jgi:hypothetical protein
LETPVKALYLGLAASLTFSAAAHADAKNIAVPADVRARYMIVDKGWIGGERTVVTKRVARDGITFTKRLYNCEKNTVRSLGEASSIEALDAATPDTRMSAIAPQSVAYYISLEACKYLKDS